MGWNNRVVRRRHEYTYPNGVVSVSYTYGIHEAYYDKLGKVVAITQEPVDPFGDTISDLRRGWCQMAGAFGQPILDYDQIPEPGHDVNDRLVNTSDIKEAEMVSASSDESEEKELPCFQNFDRAGFDREQEIDRLSEEQNHIDKFVGTQPFKGLVEKIFSDYNESRKKD